MSAGLYINILEQPEAIKHDMQIPSIMAQTCRDWSAWTGKNGKHAHHQRRRRCQYTDIATVVPEIDSGL